MNIAVFSRSFDGIVGGVEKMVLTLSSELVKLGHKVVVISLDSSSANAFYPWPKGVVWEKIDLGNPDFKANFSVRLKRILKMRKLLSTYQVDSAVGFQIGCFALIKLSSIGLGIHTVAAERNAPTLFKFIKHGKRLRLISNLLLCSSDVISVQMDTYKSFYPKHLRRKIFVNPNPIFTVQTSKKKAYKVTRPIKLLYVGRLSYQKNLQVLIRAIAESGLEAELTIVGDGGDLAEIQALAASINVTLIHAPPKVLLSTDYLNADIFCITSRWEGFPNVVGEALAHGLPVVAFAGCAGMSELIIPGVNGVLAVGNGNFKSFAEALLKASQIEWNPEVIIESCKQYSIENFTQKWVAALSPRGLRK